MSKRLLGRGLAFGLTAFAGVLWAATGEDFDMEVVPPSAQLLTSGGSAAFDVLVTTRIDKTQGWSFGMVFENDAGVTAQITELKGGSIIDTLYNGNPAEFKSLTWYRADETLGADCYGTTHPTPGICAGIEAGSFTEGIVIHLMQLVTMPPKPDGIVVAEIIVAASGPEGAQARLVFVDTAGEPDIATVFVHGGLSIAPGVQSGAAIEFIASQCVPPSQFTAAIVGGDGGTGDLVESRVILNFDANPEDPNAFEIQGWSYGICIGDPSKLGVVNATIDGTMTATAKDGDPPDFDSILIYPEGVTHGVSISLVEPLVTIPAQNGWTDMVVTYEILMEDDFDFVYVTPCSGVLGTPPLRNVMSIKGRSVEMSPFEGTDPADPVRGCCNLASCNGPGRFEFRGGASFVPGSANGDGYLDLSDGPYILMYLFGSGPEPPCLKAADANGDCAVDSADVLYILWYLFLQGPAPTFGVGCQFVSSNMCRNLTCEVSECGIP